MNAPDAITTELTYAAILELRGELQAWTANLSLSAPFRALCVQAVRAIGQCSETDTSSHPAVVHALELLNMAAIDEAAGLAARFDLLLQQIGAMPECGAACH